MDATQTQRLSRPVVRVTVLAGLGALGVFLWMLASLLFGGTAAHAETTASPGGGLLGGVSGTVAKVTGAVTQTTTGATGAVAQTTKSVIQQTSAVADVASRAVQSSTTTVAKVPVVSAITTPVVHAVQRTVATATTRVVQPVVAPVVHAVENGVAKPLVAPVVQLVTAVPVVGDIVKTTGIDTTLTGVAGAVDTTVGTVVGGTAGAVTGSIPPVLTGPGASGSGSDPNGALPGTTPSSPSAGLPGVASPGAVGAVSPPALSAPVDAASASAIGSTMATLTRSFAAVALVSARDVAAAWFPTSSAPAAPGSPFAGMSAQCVLGGACSFGPSGAATGALGALSILAFVAAYRAWMRRREQDDRVPHAPVYATDTSPD
ncbi:hypothetical protein [Microbacterium mangrovi]|nr:hypothetical protein [Microbacterium mangrovi]